MNTDNGLIVINELLPEKIFSSGGVDPIIDQIKAQVTGFVPDLKTATGRKEIASLAHKVAKSKVLLDDLGKNLVATWKRQSAVVDAERKRMRDALDALKDEVRKPLTEWEEAEKARVEMFEADISEIRSAGERSLANWMDLPAKDMQGTLAGIKSIAIDGTWAEFATEAAVVKDKAVSQIEQAIAKRRAYDQEQAELALLRKEQAEREEAERLDRIRKEAAEKARLEAEAKAKAEADRIEQEKQEAIRKQQEAERQKAEAEQREKEGAAKAERDRIAAEERAKIEQEVAVRAAEKRAQEEAARKESERLAKEETERKEAERKAANKRHRAKIELAAVTAIIGIGYSQADALKIIAAISEGKIDHVTINY